jgi:serine/threonine-protein kinase
LQVNSDLDSGAQEGLPQTIAGFRVVRRLATGGTSDVLLAHANGPNGFERAVVLKLLLAEYKDDPSFERMFAVEAAAYARLAHPSIVKLYDFFATGDQLVMVLEHVDGLPLNALRAELTNAGEVLEDRAVFYLMSRVFAALAAAHAARDPETREFSPVIHRDVNPSNVLIHRDGSVKLADFGIAKVTGMAGDTKTGFIKGTFGYMSPEQVRGEQVTVRADVYAATLLLWELLARRRAIQHGALSDLEALRAMAHPNIVSLDVLRGDLSADLRKIIARGLEPIAENRSVTATELSEALEVAGSTEEGRARLIAAVEKASASGVASLSQTAPSPSISESMALLAEADDGVPPLPSYSVPAPPFSDSDMADTGLSTQPLSSRRPQASVPDDIPTKPAHESEIAQALSADDSLELPRFPMPSMSDAPPARGSEPKPPPRPDPKQALDAATEAPSSSRRGKEASRLGAPIAPRPVIPRPMSVAPNAPTSSPSPSPRAAVVSSAMGELKPPSSNPSLPKPKTMMGGFTATGSNPPPAMHSDPPPIKTAPMAIVPSALNAPDQKSASGPLSTTLAMAAPIAPNSPSSAPATPPLPIMTADRHAESGGGMFRKAMPTAPASFAPMPPNVVSAQASHGTLRPGFILAGLGAFLISAAAITVALVHFADKGAVTVGSPKVVVASVSASGSAVGPVASTQPDVGKGSGHFASAQPDVGKGSGHFAGAQANVEAGTGNFTTAQPNPVAVTPTATATASAAAAPQIPPQSAALVAGKEARQHRIFVDGKPIGEGPGTYFISCGTHTVKVGSSGKPRDIDAACGSSINVP